MDVSIRDCQNDYIPQEDCITNSYLRNVEHKCKCSPYGQNKMVVYYSMEFISNFLHLRYFKEEMHFRRSHLCQKHHQHFKDRVFKNV